MRILVISDIHANWPALSALNEPHDVCFCLGDLVDYGLEPAPCIDWVRRVAHYVVRGNHDHGVAQNVIVNGTKGFKYLSGVTRPITRELLNVDEFRYLGRLPVTTTVTIAKKRYLLVHATPRDPLDEYASPDPAYWKERLEGCDADVICVGHTHIPFVLQVGHKLVVNPGSIGVPRDGDPRAAYAVIENGKAEIKRVAYPIDETIRKITESALPADAKKMLEEAFRTGAGVVAK